MNLLEETLYAIKRRGKTIDDIIWIGNCDGTLIVPVSNLKTILNVEYDSGYGAQEIASDLVIVGKDWWMERHEYDGAESWNFKKLPILAPSPKLTDRVKGGMWNTLEEIMGGS